jgi:glycerol-3-phosphate dehydrogenase
MLDGATSAADMGQSFGPLSEREVDWLRNNEWARTSDDVLWRRSKLGLHTTKPQQEALRTYMAAANAVQELKRARV